MGFWGKIITRFIAISLVGTGLISTGLIGAAPPALAAMRSHALLQGVDKVTARISSLHVAVGSVVEYGSLLIQLHHCDRTSPQEAPESSAFIQIFETENTNRPEQIFSGWMFASSPALNALEHPIYDLWVVECLDLEPVSDADPG